MISVEWIVLIMTVFSLDLVNVAAIDLVKISTAMPRNLTYIYSFIERFKKNIYIMKYFIRVYVSGF